MKNKDHSQDAATTSSDKSTHSSRVITVKRVYLRAVRHIESLQLTAGRRTLKCHATRRNAKEPVVQAKRVAVSARTWSA